MKHTLILIITLLAIVSCKNTPTTPPPPPYTDKEVCRMYVEQFLNDALDEPESLEILEEKCDSGTTYQKRYDGSGLLDTLHLYSFDLLIRFRNPFGGISKQRIGIVCCKDNFYDTDVYTGQLNEYSHAWGKNHHVYEYSNVMQKVHLADSIRTARWNAYQDSIQSTKTH